MIPSSSMIKMKFVEKYACNVDNHTCVNSFDFSCQVVIDLLQYFVLPIAWCCIVTLEVGTGFTT